ncbi:hypothetical protein EDC01DRAFT_626698 [Geopyxis carbonaria]|nr:hypothetical protein EDC01DRAFT_626698 [Geopyxis carbonaria]
MDQQSQQNPTGPGGRRLHIAHRRSPSELTPLMSMSLSLYSKQTHTPETSLHRNAIYGGEVASNVKAIQVACLQNAVEQLALQQQIEMLQAQQQQMLSAHQQYANMGLLPPGQTHLPPGFNPMQHQQMPTGISPQQQQQGNFQFPGPQQGAAPPGAPTQPSSHRRNASALPGMGGGTGPPPAPSSGSAGTNFGEFSMNNPSGGNNGPPQRRTSGPGGERGHQRRHSLALPEAKKAAELAQQRRGQPGFQFPAPSGSPSNDNPSPATQTTAETTAAPATSQPQATATPTAPSGPPRAGRGGGGHGRSQSLAMGMNGRSPVGGGRIGTFQFPPPMATSDAGAPAQGGQQQQGGQGVERRGSNPNFQGHNRTGSRNYEGNWRNQNQNQQSNDAQGPNQGQQFGQFQPGHRSRASMGASIGSFQFNPQPNLMIPGAAGQGIFINPATGQPQIMNPNLLQQQQLAQLQMQQASMGGQQLGLGNLGNLGNNQQQQQRKTLFTPYLPQASLPALLSNGQLVSGILRVNKKNRSDAYVSTQDGLLDADIFICGSKDRNRALEGDLVAIELLDVDEVWGQKREKEEKKKRKDITDSSRGSNVNNNSSGDGNVGNDASGDQPAHTGGMRRRGSLRQRPTQKKNDDVEVEGQSLLLVEEEEISDEQKPLYAGHVVAVIERVAGQMFSGTLGLLRPSSQATKEKQEAERAAREGHNSRPQPERTMDKPKIVWFKPTDKRVPLIAIPTEQAPKDFVENHQSYSNRIFVACIKRWPITSLHPFGTLVEQLGEMGVIKVETDALLRDNNFGPDEFSDAVVRNVGFEEWSLESESEDFIAARKDFRGEQTFCIIPKEGAEVNNAFHVKKVSEGVWEIGVHVADVTHFVKPNSLVDREAKKRGTAVELVNRYVPMLPQQLGENLASLKPGEDRLAFSVVFTLDEESGKVEADPWVGKSIVKNNTKLTYSDVDQAVSGDEASTVEAPVKEAVATLMELTKKLRQHRYDAAGVEIPPLRLLYQTDDENVPVEENIFESLASYEIVEEILIKTNSIVAEKIVTALPEKALLRRQSPPSQRRLTTFGDRINRLGYKIDTSSGATLQNSLFRLEDADVRRGMETLLIKGIPRAKYFVSGKFPAEFNHHYVYNLPVYTHFTNPLRRYTDIIVQRQLEAALSNGAIEFTEDAEALGKTAEQCNVKKDSAKNAQEQSIHIELCRAVDKRRVAQGGELICEAIVICVYESAFDVLIPEYGFEKRVHCDQLPLKKAEFDKTNRVLELYWEKGTQSNAYIPEDERPKGGAALRAANEAAAATAAAAKAKAAQEHEEKQRKMMDISSLSVNDVDALFDDDEEASDTADTEQSSSSGVNLAPPQASTRPTQSMPGSPTKSPTSSQAPHRTRSDPKISVSALDSQKNDDEGLSNAEKYLHMFTVREERGENIQEVRELTKVPVFLKTELSKSPPCLTIRSLNPFAL